MPSLYNGNGMGILFLITIALLLWGAIRQGRKLSKEIERRDDETRKAMGIDDGNDS